MNDKNSDNGATEQVITKEEVPSTSSATNNDTEVEDDVVVLKDIIDETEKTELDAIKVLGPADADNCSYAQGYVTRQPLYSCKTCTTPQIGNAAGVCLACSLVCHDQHDLVELYTKRNFRCDCGNEKFGSFQCQLFPDKKSVNADNSYNQNFSGLYCACKRPYPDDEDEVDDEMIQCCVCEDWFHGRHLFDPIGNAEGYAEMTCQRCMENLPFLRAYSSDFNSSNEIVGCSLCDKTTDGGDGDKTVCKMPKLTEETNENLTPTAVYWSEHWRCKLCRCTACLDLYAINNCSFLLSDADTVAAYECQSAAEVEGTSVEKAMAAFASRFGRTEQVDLLQGYNQMKSELSARFEKLSKDGKVISKEDIFEVFEGLNKRRRVD